MKKNQKIKKKSKSIIKIQKKQIKKIKIKPKKKYFIFYFLPFLKRCPKPKSFSILKVVVSILAV